MTDDGVARLQLRLDRERRARRQAEIIAERGMRELWQANSELQERVTQRTADLERRARARRYREWARSTLVLRSAAALRELERTDLHTMIGDAVEVRRHLDAIVRLLGDDADRIPEAVATQRALVEVADEVVDGWQHVAARSGRLLSVEVAPGRDAVAVDWSAARAALDAALDQIVRHPSPGALAVTLAGSDEGLDVLIAAGTTGRGSAATRVDDQLAEAELIAGQVGGAMRVDVGSDVSTITLTMPGSRRS